MSNFNFETVLRNYERLKVELPKVLANDAVRYFNDSFKKQGWDGFKWQSPQRKIPGTYAYIYPKKGAKARHTRATLVESGRLRRAVATSNKRISFQSILFVVNLPYAEIHNEGLKMRWGGNMPKRKFMGDSRLLRKLQKEKINLALSKIWRA